MRVGIQHAPHDAVSAPLVVNEEEKSLHASYVQHLGGGGGGGGGEGSVFNTSKCSQTRLANITFNAGND